MSLQIRLPPRRMELRFTAFRHFGNNSRGPESEQDSAGGVVFAIICNTDYDYQAGRPARRIMLIH